MSLQLTQSQVWSILQSCKDSQFKPPDVNKAMLKVCAALNIKEHLDIKNILQAEIQEFTRIGKQNRTKNKASRNPGTNKVVFNRDDYETEKTDLPTVSPPVKKLKNFLDVCDISKRTRTDDMVDKLKQFVADENLVDSNTNEQLNINQVLGYLLHRVNYMDNKKLAKIGKKLMNNEDITVSNGFDCTDAITLMHDMALSKEQMRTMRRYCSKKGIHFPSTTSLLEERKMLKPPISPILEDKGVMVDYVELTLKTTASIFDVINEKRDIPLDTSVEYQMYYKDGGDGAGSQTVLKSKSAVGTASNIFQYALVPLRLECESTSDVIWRNPAANGASWVRPIFLIREKEDDTDLLHHVIPYTDKNRDFLNTESVAVTSFRRPDNVYQVQHNVNDTMKDLKFKKICSGLGGADCILCDSRQDDWMSEDKIRNGFQITRSAQETLDIYFKLVTSDGEIESLRNDYDMRKGLTQKPLTTSDQQSICITHSYINITNWFVKVLSRMNMAYEHWVEKKNCYGDPIRAGNTNVLTSLEDETGLRLDQVCGPTSKGGGSTDGNQGRRFFGEKTLPSILNCIDPKYHNVVRELHRNLSCILRVISSEDAVRLDIYEELVISTSLLIARELKWVKINYTLHGVIHHSVQLIALNECYGLGNLSEEGLEANNKYIRRYSELLARKTSQIDQLTDVLGRLLRAERSIYLKSEAFVSQSITMLQYLQFN